MKTIITGATGFLGAALCKNMLEAGHEVTAVIRPDTCNRSKLDFGEGYGDRFHVIELEIEKLEGLPDRLEAPYDVFYHLAWVGTAGTEREDFKIQYRNVGYTVQAVLTAAECGCTKFVGAGSQAEYGVVRRSAKEGETVPQPFMMYGAAKLAAYHMGSLEADKMGISFVWPRIYSIYGVGENKGTLVNYVIECLCNGVTPELSACENVWDYMYISDCTDALRILGEIKETRGIYNVSAGNPRPLRLFVEEIRDIVNIDGQLGFGIKQGNPDKTFWLEPDVGRLRELGMECKVSFSDGIKAKMKAME